MSSATAFKELWGVCCKLWCTCIQSVGIIEFDWEGRRCVGIPVGCRPAWHLGLHFLLAGIVLNVENIAALGRSLDYLRHNLRLILIVVGCWLLACSKLMCSVGHGWLWQPSDFLLSGWSQTTCKLGIVHLLSGVLKLVFEVCNVTQGSLHHFPLISQLFQSQLRLSPLLLQVEEVCFRWFLSLFKHRLLQPLFSVHLVLDHFRNSHIELFQHHTRVASHVFNLLSNRALALAFNC